MEKLPIEQPVSVDQPTQAVQKPKTFPSWASFSPLSVALLIVGAFFLGSYSTKVTYLEKNGTTLGVQAAGAAVQAKAAPPAGVPTIPPQPTTAPVKSTVEVGNFPVKGNKDAKVTVIAFEDFRCPFCKKTYEDVEQQIIKEYVDTGKVKLAFRNYQFLGPASVTAGNAAECANEQNKFWEFHDYMYKNQPSESDTSLFTTDKLTDIAGTLGMNTSQFRTCLSSTKYQKNVDQDFSDGQKAGVTGTPTFYINGTQLVGAQPYSAFKNIIDQELAK